MPRPRSPFAALVALASFALVAGACSQQDDPTPEELQEDVAEELRERDSSLSADQAECFAGLIVEELGVDEIQDVEFSDEEPTPELAEGIAAAAVAARAECGLTDAQG
jgi:hypothetical protein